MCVCNHGPKHNQVTTSLCPAACFSFADDSATCKRPPNVGTLAKLLAFCARKPFANAPAFFQLFRADSVGPTVRTRSSGCGGAVCSSSERPVRGTVGEPEFRRRIARSVGTATDASYDERNVEKRASRLTCTRPF